MRSFARRNSSHASIFDAALFAQKHNLLFELVRFGCQTRALTAAVAGLASRTYKGVLSQRDHVDKRRLDGASPVFGRHLAWTSRGISHTELRIKDELREHSAIVFRAASNSAKIWGGRVLGA